MTPEEMDRRITTLEIQMSTDRGDWLALHDQMVTMLSKSAGLKAGWLYLLGFVAALGTVISIIQVLMSG